MPTESFDDRFALVEREREDMHAYQGIAYDFLSETPFAGLFIDMGLGKTVIAGTVAHDYVTDFDNDGKVLIIGPLKVATMTWPDEFKKWRHLAALNITVLRENDDDPRIAEARRKAREEAKAFGAEFEMSREQINKFANYKASRADTATRRFIREQNARSRTRIHIVSREHVEWLVDFHQRDWPYRVVIIDESDSFKDHESLRFKALAKLRRIPGYITRLIILTATPAAESYMGLFAQIFLLDRGERFTDRITRFRNRFFVQNKYTQKYKLREGGEEDILEKIKDICLVMRAKDYLPIKDPIVIQRKVHLTASQMALYEELQKHFVVTLPSGAEIEAETAAALSQKLLQVASGVLYETILEEIGDDDFKNVRKVHHIHDHKIEMLKELVEEANGEPLLVTYYHKASLDRLVKAFPKAEVMDRQGKKVTLWNSRKMKYPMMIVHPMSAGHGLNMQKGGHNIVIFDLFHSLGLYLQLVGRLNRQGQTNPVVVQMLVAAGTRDEQVAKDLIDKEERHELFFETLQRLIRKYRKEKMQ